MQLFDDGYLERREKQIRDSITLKAVSQVLTYLASAFTFVLFFLTAHGSISAAILLTVTLAVWIVAGLTYALYKARTVAEREIQKEHERLMKLYSQAGEKAKRDTKVRLSDEGELVTDEENPADRAATSDFERKYLKTSHS